MILGIDDCHRAEVLGSLIIAGVVIDENKIPILKKIGVTDSKLLTKTQRFELFPQIMYLADKVVFEKISAEEISKITKEHNLNDLECERYCRIAKWFKEKYGKYHKVIINNFDRNREKFIWRAKKLGFKDDFSYTWKIEHNNEAIDLPVGAASIVAKTYSDLELAVLKDKFGEFGSSNPNDKKTIRFIKKHLNDNCPIVRYSWITVKRLKKED